MKKILMGVAFVLLLGAAGWGGYMYNELNSDEPTYVNRAIGFSLTLPNSDWFSPSPLDEDPHFYAKHECAYKQITEGILGGGINVATSDCASLTISRYDEVATFGVDNRMKQYKDDGDNPTLITDLIPGAVVIRYSPPPMARGWNYAYEIIFEKEKMSYGVFTNNLTLGESILSTFRLNK